ncbi:hypothetical protein GQ44DRAFT_736216 [Phaeosphaeriaceae sp. PMI808]|nr:hypothetical protein GQ44DRAFT_736216 [Phaeosphaeriaceae sp. PMI808]
MKTFTIASVIALASVASAQLEAIPACALTCFVGPLQSDGCAALTDFKCHCEKGATLVSSVTPCVKKSCSAADESAAIAAVSKICMDAGVPLVLPSSPAASSAAPVSSAAAPVSSAAGAASSAAAPVKSSAAGAVSSAAGAASSAASYAASMASSAASKVSSAMASATGNGTVPVKPSATPSQFTGGAPQATAVGILGAAALAMLVL